MAYDASLLVIYNCPTDRLHRIGEVAAIDIPASKFATWDSVNNEYISNKKVTSPRGVKIHVTDVPDALNLRKLIVPDVNPETVNNKTILVITSRMAQNLTLSIRDGDKKEATIGWDTFKGYLRNVSKDREIIDEDILLTVDDFVKNDLSSAIGRALND